MPLARPRRRARQGAALPLTLIIFLVTTVLGLVIFTLSTTSSHLAFLGWQKTQATAAAEAGVHALYAQIAAAQDATPPTTPPATASGTLSSTVGASTTGDGSYSASVSSATAAGTTTHTFTSTGTAADGVTRSTVRTRCTAIQVPGGPFTFPDGSLISNGPIRFGNSHTATVDNSGIMMASVISNGAITLGNNAFVDGSLKSATTITASSGQYRGTKTTGVSTPFPTAAQMNAWKAIWLSTGQSGTQYASCPASGTTIQAPAYINGDLSSNITIRPCPGTSSVVYVNGDISGNVTVSSDGAPTDGVTLVATGTFLSENLRETNEPYTCTVVVFDPATISFDNHDRNIIEGVIYSVNGGFDLKNPQWTFNGTLIAGGLTGIDFGNGGGNASVQYPGNHLDSRSDAFTFPNSLSELTQWVQTL